MNEPHEAVGCDNLERGSLEIRKRGSLVRQHPYNSSLCDNCGFFLPTTTQGKPNKTEALHEAASVLALGYVLARVDNMQQ